MCVQYFNTTYYTPNMVYSTVVVDLITKIGNKLFDCS